MEVRNIIKTGTRILLVLAITVQFSCSGRLNVTEGELLTHIKYLSSDSLKGRQTGMTGDSLAAQYIKNELASYGFIPLSNDGFQRFRVTNRVFPGPDNYFSMDGKKFIPENEFIPFAFTSDTVLESEVLFAGYGFCINNDTLKWDDYKDIDPSGKWIMILRADPETDKAVSPFIPFSADRDKALLAKDMGAAGVIMVSGPTYNPQDTFESLNAGDYSVGIPSIRIKREVADAILEKTGTSVSKLEKRLNSTRKPVSFTTGMTVRAGTEIIIERNSTRNVAMVLPGQDELLKNEYIIIGAHFDHLGMGGSGSSSRATDTVAVHHGADDNASGVALMLELAEKLAHTKERHKRSIICIAFSGEEMGLLGSKYFVESAEIDLSKVNAMINLDMVGRLTDSTALQVSGIGTAEGLKELLIAGIDTGAIKLIFLNEGFGPSDHSSFYGKSIPVLFCTTGAHLDYHTPADTYDKINYKGIVTISSVVFKAVNTLSNTTSRLEFRESGPKIETGRAMRKKGVTLGIMPDFAGNIKNGLRADFVTPGKPAALGGMKKGDIIISINGKTVNNIQDYMFRMGQLKHGQIISVEVLRNNKPEVLLIQL
jgi:hypothetical protein